MSAGVAKKQLLRLFFCAAGPQKCRRSTAEAPRSAAEALRGSTGGYAVRLFIGCAPSATKVPQKRRRTPWFLLFLGASQIRAGGVCQAYGHPNRACRGRAPSKTSTSSKNGRTNVSLTKALSRSTGYATDGCRGSNQHQTSPPICATSIN